MINLFQDIKSALHYNKFILDELLFVEYTCPIPDEEIAVWTETDYIIHVLSGEKTWRTIDGTIHAKAGETIYIKKGASFIRQYFYEDFCMMGFFISDSFIKNAVTEARDKIPMRSYEGVNDLTVDKISTTSLINSYFQGMLPYFSNEEKPSNSILELKFKELFISILTSKGNESIIKYFLNLTDDGQVSLSSVMDKNFLYNLSLEEFANLCGRSLSSFKRDFQKHYNIAPGKWILSKRLDHAALLLQNDSTNVSRVAYESGFEDTSHFSRVFKDKFGSSPLQYKKRLIEQA